MKKRFFGLLAALLLSVLILQPIAAAPTEFHWYCKRNKEHKQALCDPSMRFVEDYGGYYIDHRHGDDSAEKVVYLTFDAGYENGNVEKILDTLKETGTPGAFFILSHFARANADLVGRMQSEGHLVCNHTASHRNLSGASVENVEKELKTLESVCMEATGVPVAKYFRPPEGSFSKEMMEHVQTLGYKTVFWSLAYADWDNDRQMSPDAALKLILDNMHNGAVLLLHPTSATNAAILGKLIDTLRADGYRFGTLEELCV